MGGLNPIDYTDQTLVAFNGREFYIARNMDGSMTVKDLEGSPNWKNNTFFCNDMCYVLNLLQAEVKDWTVKETK